MTNYKILINSKGVPVLMEIPEKPDFEKLYKEVNGNNAKYLLHLKQYEQALSTALADEKNHVPFKDGIFVMELVRTLANNENDFYSFGQTFDLPENIGVSFESKCIHKRDKIHCDKCHLGGACDMRKVAVLNQEKPESVPSCGDGWISVTSGIKIKIAELDGRQSDYWKGVKDGYQSALNFIELKMKEIC